MEIEFVKYQAAGNDYIYIDCLDGKSFDYSFVARKLSDRHFSIGGDGVVFIARSSFCDCRMKMFNADGSEGKMCGNAIRCVADYMIKTYYPHTNSVSVETLSGVKKVVLSQNNYVVEMGKASLFSPFPENSKPSLCYPLKIDGKHYPLHLVSVGNPHAVLFGKFDNFPDFGDKIAKHKIFEEGVNVEFAQDKEDFTRVFVWERGSGRTLACGTGACAVAFANCETGRKKKGEWQKIKMEGGNLEALVSEHNDLFLKGDAVEVFKGKVKLEYES